MKDGVLEYVPLVLLTLATTAANCGFNLIHLRLVKTADAPWRAILEAAIVNGFSILLTVALTVVTLTRVAHVPLRREEDGGRWSLSANPSGKDLPTAFVRSAEEEGEGDGAENGRRSQQPRGVAPGPTALLTAALVASPPESPLASPMAPGPERLLESKSDTKADTRAEAKSISHSLRPVTLSERRKCKICNVYKPDRSHHCRRCGLCVLRMDHHCLWLGCCIGLHNIKNFSLALVYACLWLGFLIAFQTKSIYRISQPAFLTSALQADRFLTAPVRLIFYTVHWMTTFFLFLSLIYTAFIFYAILTDQTSLELMERAVRPSSSNIEWGKYSWWENFLTVYGKHWWRWFLPFHARPQPETGFSYVPKKLLFSATREERAAMLAGDPHKRIASPEFRVES